MNIKKLILAIIAVAIFNFLAGMATCCSTFSWVYKLEPTNVWRADENVSIPFAILGMFIVDAIFVWVYALINKGIPGANRFIKGLLYGLLVVLVGLLPGMVATYTYMTVATTVVAYWTISGFIISPLKGLITAAIYGE